MAAESRMGGLSPVEARTGLAEAQAGLGEDGTGAWAVPMVTTLDMKGSEASVPSLATTEQYTSSPVRKRPLGSNEVLVSPARGAELRYQVYMKVKGLREARPQGQHQCHRYTYTHWHSHARVGGCTP